MENQEKSVIELTTFIKHCEAEKILFVAYINSRPWDANLRTACEDIIICFDQMIHRLQQ